MTPIYPPRPKGKINPADLPYYEASGEWCAQRKFNGSRNLLHVDTDGRLTAWSRHGGPHKRFVLTASYRDEILSGLALKPGVEYWLDSELMNKQTGAGNEIVLFDVLAAGRYFFGLPDQITRLELLREICRKPPQSAGIALPVTPRLWMAETFLTNFSDRFAESLADPRLEGLVLRRKSAGLDDYGRKEYETPNMIRCRKPFAKDKGYNF